VLSEGNIMEFDSPKNLLENPKSYFTLLVQENGPEFESKMRFMANHRDV